MLSTAIIVVTSFLGFYCTSMAKKPMTKYVIVILGLASLLTSPYLNSLAPFSTYFYVFVSFVAAIEPQSSLHLKAKHKAFFSVVGFIIVLVFILQMLQIGIELPKYPFGIGYLLSFALLWLTSMKKIKTRLGILIIWAGQFSLWSIQVLSA